MGALIRIQPRLLWKAVRLPCRLVERPVGILRRLRHRSPAPVAPHHLRSILVHSPNWLGDAVMSLPLLDHLRGMCPTASITVVSRPQCSGLWELHPHVDEVISFDGFDTNLTLADIAGFVRILRDRAPDAAFILPGGIEFALLHALAGIRTRVGYDSDHRQLFLTHPVRVPQDFRARHLSETYLDLGCAVGPVTVARPRLRPAPPGSRGRSGMAHPHPAPSGRLRVLFHPWATYGPAKRWPPARFAELGARIAARFGAEIVLVGTEDARGAAAEINRLMYQRALDLTGRTSIAELCELMLGSALMVSNDSGPAHLADALDVPLVVLFGSSSPPWTGPRGERSETIYHALDCSPCFQRTCPLGTYACFEAITIDEVFDRVERLLARYNVSGARSQAAGCERP